MRARDRSSRNNTSATARHRALGAVAGVVLLLVAACGADLDDQTEPGAPAEIFDRFNAMTGQERHDALVAAAQQEGTVVFYTASGGMDPVVEAFEDAYGIEVQLYAGDSELVLQRIFQEHQAGADTVDVFDDGEAYTVAAEGLTYEYVNEELTSQIPGYDPASHVVPTRLSVYVTGWNTDLVSESELPDSLDGFADPTWEGRLSVDPRNWVWYSGVLDYYTQERGWSEEDVDEMIRTVTGYSIYHERAVVQGEFLVAGEFPVSLSLYPQIVGRILRADPQAPIAWRKSDGSYIKPLIVEPQGAAVFANSPHPAAALLFMDFLLTEGQRIISDVDGTPTAITQPGGPLEGIPAEDLFPVDFQKFQVDRAEWAARFDNLLRNS